MENKCGKKHIPGERSYTNFRCMYGVCQIVSQDVAYKYQKQDALAFCRIVWNAQLRPRVQGNVRSGSISKGAI